MRIAFIGNFEAHYCTEVHHKKAFEALGHEVIMFQENTTRVHQILSTEFDMLYWTHTHGWFHNNNSAESVIEMLKFLKSRNIPTVGYHLDLWLGLHREVDLRIDPYWNLEHFFTVDKLMADWLNTNTQTKGYFLPAGVDEESCYLATPDHKKYPHEIIFTGSTHYHPEWPYRRELVDWLKATYGDRFAQYGSGGLPSLRGHDLNTLYASAKIVVGDSLCKNFDYPEYSSDRLFETSGRGGFLIYPYITGLEKHYDPTSSEILFYQFGNFEQLKRLIDLNLDMPDEIQQQRERALHRTKTTHTYRHRIQELLTTLNLK